MDTSTARTTSTIACPRLYANLRLLVDVVEDHAKDLDVVQADAALESVHLAFTIRAHAVALADRIHAIPTSGREWTALAPDGTQIIVTSWAD